MMFFDEQDSDYTESSKSLPRGEATEGDEANAGAGSAAPRSLGPNEAARAQGASSSQPYADLQVETEDSKNSKASRLARQRWWLLASGSALLLTMLTIAGVYLITKKPSFVDQIVILTVPSGAEIKLDSKDYGHSPVKLEQVRVGTYTLSIYKDGYEPIVDYINISESQPLEYKLKPLPADAAGLSPEENIRQSERRAEDAFASGRYASPTDDSALYYTEYILSLDGTNQFAIDMKERIRKAMHHSAQAAIARNDMAQAQYIYGLLVEYYPGDEEARAAAARLESQLSGRRGEVRDLVRRAEEAFRSGNLIEPVRSSAYYYSKQVLAIDKQNAQARKISNQIKEKLISASEQAEARGDVDAAVKQLEETYRHFPEDKEIGARLRDIAARRAAEEAKVNDPVKRRLQGLEKYTKENFRDALPDLLFAYTNGKATPDVIFAIGRSFQMLGQHDQAALYYLRVPHTAGDQYRSSIAALGDLALDRGDTSKALERYKEALRLGGSPLYSIASLDDRIDKIEKKQREKDDEPTPITIQVKHLHGSLRGSCKGPLTVNSTGVRYDGNDHVFSTNLVRVTVGISTDKLTLEFQGKTQEFSVARSEAERFREALSKYQMLQQRR